MQSKSKKSKSSAKIALITKDIKFYSEIAKKLKEKNEKFLSLTPEQEIPPNISVVITTKKEEKIIKERKDFKFKIIAENNASKAFEELIFLNTERNYKKIVIGIDPGKNIGISAIGFPLYGEQESRSSANIIYEAEVSSRKELVSTIKKLCKKIRSREIKIKIGRKGSWYRDLIIKELLRNFKFDIELVDEHKTSKLARNEKRKGRTSMSINVVSAREIAFKEGKKIEKNKEKNITLGEIKAIQKESRKISGNITISRELAENVLKGKLSIRKAIEIQKKET